MSPRKSTLGKGIRKGSHQDVSVRGSSTEQMMGLPAERVAAAHAFGESVTEQELDQRIEARIGDLVDRNDKQWYYQQFRPSLVGGKIPLVRRDTGQSVALINGASIYRDAHPEGVYLAHQGERFRVVSYRMKPSRGNARSTGTSSAAFVSRVGQIVVDAEQRQVATRGK
jgi:hypothetical protein